MADQWHSNKCPFHKVVTMSAMIVLPALCSSLNRRLRSSPPLLSPSLRSCLETHTLDTDLISAICAIGSSAESVAAILSDVTNSKAYAGTSNASGDDQLELDVLTDNASFAKLNSSGVFRNAISEETPKYVELTPGAPYTCSFDPLDGSSVIGPNFSVGGIYAIWPAVDTLVGCKGRECIASVVVVYGSRTTMFVTLPQRTLEVTYVLSKKTWVVTTDPVLLPPKAPNKVFAFGNLRASNDSPCYKTLLNHYLDNRYTLRYTGGMVPDVCHILSKRGGVFTNVSSKKAKAKLRYLYEIVGMALMIEVAGGSCVDESGKEMLDLVCTDDDMRVGGCMGSIDEVAKFKEIMF